LCEEHGIEVQPHAEVDDMAMLRLVARDSGALAVVPQVVVQDELRSGALAKYCVIEGIAEHFYAITAKRQFEFLTLTTLMEKAQENMPDFGD
jgi:LysR family transcriptional activator of nhaA